MDCYEEKAREIVRMGGGILLPFDAGDAEVRFSSRWHLAKLIADALREMCEATAIGDLRP